MESASNSDLQLPMRMLMSSPCLFGGTSTSASECCVTSLIETLTDTDNYIKLEKEPDYGKCLYAESLENAIYTSGHETTPTPISPIDARVEDYEACGDLIEIQTIFANKLPTQLKTVPQISPAQPSSPSTSASSLSLSLDINAGSFLALNTNYNNTYAADQSQTAPNHFGLYKERYNLDDSDDIFEHFYSNGSYFSNSNTQPYQQQQQQQQQAMQQQPQQQSFGYNYSVYACSNNTSSNTSVSVVSQNSSCLNSNSSSKQDVSVGTDVSICRDLRCKSTCSILETQNKTRYFW